MYLSVIIPTFNRYHRLVNAFHSVCNQSLDNHKYEIIIVDNGSTDETRNIVSLFDGYKNKSIRYVYEPRSGLHWARHTGAKEAKGDILAYTDDDAEVTFDWLKNLGNAYVDPSVAAAGGPITVKWTTPPPKWVPSLFPFGRLDLGNQQKALSWPQIIGGGNFSVRKSVLFQVGGFHPDTSVEDKLVGDGEVGLCRKIFSAGFKIIYMPNALVYHVQDGLDLNLDIMKHRLRVQGRSSAYIFFRLHHDNLFLFSRSIILNFLIAMKFQARSVLYYLPKSNDYYRCAAYSALYYAMAKYSLKILCNKKFRKIVMRDDWINVSVGLDQTNDFETS